MKMIWRTFAAVAEDGNRTAREVGCLQMCNQIALAIAFLVELYAPLYLWQGYPKVALFNVFAGLLILAIIPINRSRRFPLLGRNLFLLTNNVLITIYSLVFGRDSWPHLFFLNMVTLPHIVFAPQRHRYIQVWSVLPPLLFFGLEFWGFGFFASSLTLSAEQQKGIYLLISPSVFIIALLYTNYLYRLLNKHEEALQLRQLNLAAGAHFSAIAELSAGVAHEINNPLAIIRGYAEQIEILQRRQELSEERMQMIAHKVKHTVDRTTRITSSLRNLSREGTDDPFEEADLVMIIEDVLAICREGLLHEGIDLRIDLAAVRATCRCRPVQIAQVLLNLIHNAKDAVLVLPEKWIEIRLKLGSDRREISVVDSGHGINPDILPRIQQPFFTTKPPGKGTGLGLSISRKIMLAHDGQLFVDIHARHTTFVMQLPVLT